MKKTIAYMFVFLFLFCISVYSQFINFSKSDLITTFDNIGFQIGPEKQQIIVSFGGFATFQLKNLDGSQSVRIEYKEFLSIGDYQTIQGYGNISSIGTYTKTTSEIFKQLGIGIFLWRVSDNMSVDHYSDSKLLIIIGVP